MQKYHDEPKQYKGYLKSALGLKLSSPTLDDGSTPHGRLRVRSGNGHVIVAAIGYRM